LLIGCHTVEIKMDPGVRRDNGLGARAMPRLVIPAKAGIHFDLATKKRRRWVPAFAGTTI
jgi:hypothetical protein